MARSAHLEYAGPWKRGAQTPEPGPTRLSRAARREALFDLIAGHDGWVYKGALQVRVVVAEEVRDG